MNDDKNNFKSFTNNRNMEANKNLYHGVDINNKEELEVAFNKMRKDRTKNVILLLVVGFLLMGIIGGEYYRVVHLDKKPILAISKKVDNGTLYSGIGYQALYCNDGTRYADSVLYKTCTSEVKTIKDLLYTNFINYANSNKLFTKNFKSITFNEVTKDSSDDKFTDYLIDFSYECSTDKLNCINIGKEFNRSDNVKMYLRLNKYNQIDKVLPFKDSGKYYDSLIALLEPKVKEYLKVNNKLNEDNLRMFKVALASNNGAYKFRGTMYDDTYLIKINYSCLDNTNSCVTYFDKKDAEGDFANLVFYASLFLDKDGNVLLIGPREYLTLE